MRTKLTSKNMMLTMRAVKTYPAAQTLGFFAVELRVPWLEGKGNPSSRLAEWVEPTDGAGYADSAYRSAASGAEPPARSEAEAMLAQKQPRKLSGERACRSHPLSDAQKASGSASCPGGRQPGGEPADRRESNRQKSKIRARTCLRASTHRQIEHVFGYLSQSMKGFYLRSIGRRSRKAGAAIGLINLIYPATAGARYESRFRIGI